MVQLAQCADDTRIAMRRIAQHLVGMVSGLMLVASMYSLAGAAMAQGITDNPDNRPATGFYNAPFCTDMIQRAYPEGDVRNDPD
jgi:hypothetical protein